MHKPAPTAASTAKHEPASAATREPKQEPAAEAASEPPPASVAPGDSAHAPAAALGPEPGHEAPSAAASGAGQAHAPAAANVAATGEPDAARAEQESRSLAGVRVVFVLGGPGSGKGTQARPADWVSSGIGFVVVVLGSPPAARHPGMILFNVFPEIVFTPPETRLPAE